MAVTLYSGFVPVCVQLLTGLKIVLNAIRRGPLIWPGWVYRVLRELLRSTSRFRFPPIGLSLERPASYAITSRD